MKENRTKDFFVVLVVTVLLSVALGYILNRFIYFSNSVWTYVIIWAILFFGYFRVYTILETPKVLIYLVYGYQVLFSQYFFLGWLAEGLGIAAFAVLGPFEYLFNFRIPLEKINPWSDW